MALGVPELRDLSPEGDWPTRKNQALIAELLDLGNAGEPLIGEPEDGTTIVDFARRAMPMRRGQGPMMLDQGDTTIVDFDPDSYRPPMGEASGAMLDHDANLADYMDEASLAQIADKIIEWVEIDREARRPNEAILQRGLELLGLVDAPDDALMFPGACAATYPLLAEAIIQFGARALPELFPPEGPAKATVVGEQTREKEDQAERVADHLNYQLTIEDECYLEESDRLVHSVPLKGSMFRKTYFDPTAGMVVSRLVEPEDLIVPFTATSLAQSPRLTHVVPMSPNELARQQAAGVYRDVLLGPPAQELGSIGNEGELWQSIEQAQGITRSMHEDDARHILLECHCEWDLPGLEDADGIALPYRITVDSESRRVLSIRRNWRPEDPLRRKRAWFSHYKFLPGLGFYGWGYVHVIGSLADAATETLRAILDAAAFSTLSGGMKSKDSKLPGGSIRAQPGVWLDTECTAEELQKAFFPWPSKEPPEAVFKLLGLLVEAGQRVVSTTEAMVGDAANTGPVGTTVALIEQGTKVYSAIHLRLHRALGLELKLRAELNGEHLEAYPFVVRGRPQQILREDYDDRVDVIPVSDPNIWSSVQRIAQAQGIIQLTKEMPQVNWDHRAIAERAAVAMKVSDFDELAPPPAEPEPLDPVSEVSAVMEGRPVKAFPDQDHLAHMTVLTAWLQHPGFGAHPLMKEIQPKLLALIADHSKYQFQVDMMRLGVPQRPMDPASGQMAPLDPGQSRQLAMMAAQASLNLAGLPGIPQLGGPADPMAEQQAQAEAAAADAETRRQAMAADAEEGRKQASFDREQQRQDFAHRESLRRTAEADSHKQDLERRKVEGPLAAEKEKLAVDARHTEMLAAMMQQMAQVAQLLAGLAVALNQPKQISLAHDSEGNVTGATVTPAGRLQ